MKPKEEVKEKPSRNRLLFRWSLFLLTVLLAVCTLTVLIRSGEEGWELKIRKPDSMGSSSSTEVWVVHIGWCYLGLNSDSIGPRRTWGPGGVLRTVPTKVEWLSAEKMSPRLSIFDWPLKIPLFLVLAVECVALFFLVPSVIGKTGRR